MLYNYWKQWEKMWLVQSRNRFQVFIFHAIFVEGSEIVKKYPNNSDSSTWKVVYGNDKSYFIDVFDSIKFSLVTIRQK